MAALPTLTVTQRVSLKALKLEQSQVLPPGIIWLCRDRKIITHTKLENAGVFAATARNINIICVAASDFPAVKEWIG